MSLMGRYSSKDNQIYIFLITCDNHSYNPVEDETTFEISFDKSIEDEERERFGKRISFDGIKDIIMTDSPSKRARLSFE